MRGCHSPIIRRTRPTLALTQSPIVDILSQGGLSLFAGFDNIQRNLDLLQQGAANAQSVNLAEMPGSSAGNPLYILDADPNRVRKVEIIGGVEVTNKVQTETEVKGTVNVKQIGAVQVTQSGEWVMRLAGGGTIPVRVEGGRMVVDIAGGLEGLAVNLADTEVGLRAVGAL